MGKKKQKRKQARREAREMAMLQAMGARNRNGLMNGIADMLPSGSTEQFLLGAAIGAAAAYVLGDEALRGKLMKAGVQLYSNVMSGYLDDKEQLAELQAEVDTERQSA